MAQATRYDRGSFPIDGRVRVTFTGTRVATGELEHITKEGTVVAHRDERRLNGHVGLSGTPATSLVPVVVFRFDDYPHDASIALDTVTHVEPIVSVDERLLFGATRAIRRRLAEVEALVDTACPTCGAVDGLLLALERSEWEGTDLYVCQWCEARVSERDLAQLRREAEADEPGEDAQVVTFGDQASCASCGTSLVRERDNTGWLDLYGNDHGHTPSEPELVSIPAFAAPVLDEKLTVLAPRAWHARIARLAESTCYGPSYRRAVVDNLRDVDHLVRQGYTALAYDRLVAAERAAGITVAS